MVGWNHRLDGHEFEQALVVGDGQGGLACCSPWGRIESDTTALLNDKWLICSSHHHTVFSCHTTCPCSTFLLPYIFLIIYSP